MSKPEFVYVTYIETTPEKLWEALTSSEFSKRYWFGTEVRSDWKVGSPFALVTDGETTDTGEVLEADPPRRLAYTFKHEKFEEMRNDSLVIEFERCNDIEELNLESLRGRLASWLKEECSFILRCAQPFATMDAQNIIISELFCEGPNSRLGLFMRWSAGEPLEKKSNQVDMETMTSVLHAREHLLSEALTAGHIIRMGKGSEIMPEKRITYSFAQLLTFAGISALVTFVLSSTLVLCVAWQVVGWSRLRYGLWKQKKPSLAQLNKELRLRRDHLQEIPMNRMAV